MNFQSELRFASYPGIRPPRLPNRGSTRIRLATVALVVGLLASLAGAASAGDTLCPVAERVHAEPGTVFDTIEAAAVDALAHAHHTSGPGDRGRLLLGTIHRVGDGFAYSEPMRSRETVWSSRAPVLRFAFKATDVASYVLHPRSGSIRIDRANESPNESERRVVDELDPQARPLFVLTPSRRIVRYQDRVTTQVAARPDRPVVVAAR
ncbi:MAG: hypothetical protein AAGC67_16245 [Myxococcota bacterium]